MNIQFTDEIIQQIFGHEAAEDENIERLRAYYFKSDVYERMRDQMPFKLLVGFKGIGKSALISVAMADDRDDGILPILIKPDDVLEYQPETNDILPAIKAWKEGITKIVYRKCLEEFGAKSESPTISKSASLLQSIVSVLRPRLESTFDYGEATALLGRQFLRSQKVRVYLDDLDRGWKADESSILQLSALLNALRDLARTETRIHFRAALRSDVYFLVRTSDESTDKIEGSVVWQSWTNHEILAMLVQRVQSFLNNKFDQRQLLGKRQSQLAAYLDTVIDPRFHGSGQWRNIPTYRMMMSVIRQRPRDLVKLCTLAAREAAKVRSTTISTDHFKAVFDTYSQDRLQDTCNEFRSELKSIEVLLLAMRPSGNQRKQGVLFYYKTNELLEKLKNIMSSQPAFVFYGGRPATEKDLAALLYRIGFLTATKESENFTERRVFEQQRYLSSRFVDFGFDWEVHPAYRWALSPATKEEVWESLREAAEAD